MRNIARIEKNIRNINASIIWQIEKNSVKLHWNVITNWVELRYNIPICAYFLVRTNKTCRVILYNPGIGSFVVGEEAYGTKWRCWEKEQTREETKREPWSKP